MAFEGRVEGGAPAASCVVEVGEEALSVATNGGAPVLLPYADIDDVHDDDYVLRLTDHTGARLDLSMFGSGYGQLVAELVRARDRVLERDLLLTGVGLRDTYPAKLFGGAEPRVVEVRLYEDLMVVKPERGTMFGVPYALVERVDWDEELYQTRVVTDDGQAIVLGQMAKRSEEFRDELRRLLAALASRTAATLGTLLPGVAPGSLAVLANVMRDGRAVQQRVVDAIDPALWPRLEDAVVGTDELRASYEALKAAGPPGWAAFGVKAVVADASGPERDGNGAGPAGAPDRAASDLWYFCPLARDGRPLNAVAQEVTSEPGHATYVYRLMEPERFASLSGDGLAEEVGRAIARLNRALLQLNFRREPIYLSDDRIPSGEFARYRVALRKLPYLRWARRAFLGRAVHNGTWERQLQELASAA